MALVLMDRTACCLADPLSAHLLLDEIRHVFGKAGVTESSPARGTAHGSVWTGPELGDIQHAFLTLKT